MSLHRNSHDPRKPIGRPIKPVDPTADDRSLFNELTPEQFVRAYRGVIAQLKAQNNLSKAEFQAIAMRLREGWKELHGEDSLHELAFGEPLP